MVLLVAVRVRDVREVDVERHTRLEDVVDRLERLGEQARLEVGAVARRVHVREVEHGPHPAGARRDLDHVVERAEVADATHHLDAERHCPVLALEPLAQRAELLDDGRDRVLALASEQEAGVEDDDLGAAGGGNAGTAVERSDGGGELAAARLEVPHEAEERRVHRERHVCRAGDLSELLGPRVVHPEAALEVDLAGVVAPFEQELDRMLRVVAGGNAGEADTGSGHSGKLPGYSGTVMRTVWPCGAKVPSSRLPVTISKSERLPPFSVGRDPTLPHVGCGLGEAADECEDCRPDLPDPRLLVGRAKLKIERPVGREDASTTSSGNVRIARSM